MRLIFAIFLLFIALESRATTAEIRQAAVLLRDTCSELPQILKSSLNRYDKETVEESQVRTNLRNVTLACLRINKANGALSVLLSADKKLTEKEIEDAHLVRVVDWSVASTCQLFPDELQSYGPNLQMLQRTRDTLLEKSENAITTLNAYLK